MFNCKKRTEEAEKRKTRGNKIKQILKLTSVLQETASFFYCCCSFRLLLLPFYKLSPFWVVADSVKIKINVSVPLYDSIRVRVLVAALNSLCIPLPLFIIPRVVLRPVYFISNRILFKDRNLLTLWLLRTRECGMRRRELTQHLIYPSYFLSIFLSCHLVIYMSVGSRIRYLVLNSLKCFWIVK